jgi:hypothetical protein
VSRLLGRRKIAVVEDDEESTFANPNDLGQSLRGSATTSPCSTTIRTTSRG